MMCTATPQSLRARIPAVGGGVTCTMKKKFLPKNHILTSRPKHSSSICKVHLHLRVSRATLVSSTELMVLSTHLLILSGVLLAVLKMNST